MISMAQLNTSPNLTDPDGFYSELLLAHEGLTDEASAARTDASGGKVLASDTRRLEENQQTKDQVDILWGSYTAQVIYSFAPNQP